MPPSVYDLWSEEEVTTEIEITCFLPNSIVIPLKCKRDATITSIKRVSKLKFLFWVNKVHFAGVGPALYEMISLGERHSC